MISKTTEELREELQEIRKISLGIAMKQAKSPLWCAAWHELAMAADRVDAMMARAELMRIEKGATDDAEDPATDKG